MSPVDLLEIDDLTVRFGTTTGVRNISLQVPAGRMTGVLGANGAGKTTTLLGIHARVPRASGRILFDGQDVTGLNMWPSFEPVSRCARRIAGCSRT